MVWLTGWTRRKLKIVENLTVSDYQMKLMIHKSGLGPDTSTDIYLGDHCRDDFADLRFTGPDQTTHLSYWIESITGTTSNLVAAVWIKIPTLTPTNNIYIYYDNPIASSISDGTNTFEFFDHFEGSSIDTTKWEHTTIYGNAPTVASSIATIFGVPAQWNIWRGKTFFSVPHIFEFLGKETEGDGTHIGIQASDGPYGYNSLAWWFSTPIKYYRTMNAGIGTLTSRTTQILDWTRLKIVSTASNVKFYENDVETTVTATVPQSAMAPVFSAVQIGQNTSFDWVFVRKYASPEPIFGTTGTEELGITATYMFLNTNTCAGSCQIIAGVTWQNLGSSSVTFTPAILIDNNTIAYATSNITIGPNPATGSSMITTQPLLAGTHTICPYPN